MRPHCWHYSADPRCDGFERETPKRVSSFAYADGLDGDELETYARGKKYVERRQAHVCCRCHAAEYKKPWFGSCPVKPGMRAVERVIEDTKGGAS